MQQSHDSGNTINPLEQMLQRKLRVGNESHNIMLAERQQPASCKESKNKLLNLIKDKQSHLKLLEASVCHLRYLVGENDATFRELQGTEYMSGDCATKLLMMQDIEDRLQIFQGGGRGDLSLLNTSKAWGLLRDGLLGCNWRTDVIKKRIRLFLETNDSVWLLVDSTSSFMRRMWMLDVSLNAIWEVYDSMELLLMHVRNCLRLPQDREGWLPKQPLDEGTKLSLRQKYKVRLELWKERGSKLQHLLGKLDDLCKYWPNQYQVRTH